MEKIIEVYGKQIKTDKGTSFISASMELKEKTSEGKKQYINVRFTSDANIKLTEGYNKIKFNTEDSNVKVIDGKEGKKIKVLYINKAERLEYTEQEVLDLF